MNTFIFDIDGTIIEQKTRETFNLAKPYKKMIDKINKLYEKGNKIYIYTARPMEDAVYTNTQLTKIGLKFHHVFFGKPVGSSPETTFYIDDRSMKPKEFMEEF